MSYQKTTVILLIIKICILQALSHTVDVQDAKVFDIALDVMNYDEESENEMIQSADLTDLKPLAEDEKRYKSLHSHVKYYNEHNAENEKQYSNVFFYMQPYAKEIFNLQEDKPFIAGFKHELDKTMKQTTIAYATSIKTINHTSFYNSKRSIQNLGRLRLQSYNGTTITTDLSLIYKSIQNIKSIRIKREEIVNHYETTLNKEMDFFQVMKDRDIVTGEAETTEYFEKTQEIHMQYDMYEYGQKTTSENIKNILNQSLTLKGRSTLADTESPDEELYDYEKFKMEYEQQLEYNIKHGKILNYTEKDELEDIPKEALKGSENCTKEELSQIGIKALKCLLYDYQHVKDITHVNRILSRTWLVLKIWLLIYICLAIPCWCQRGWCCCCFRCKFCFPQKRITFAKQYYTMNPPGTFVKDLKKEKHVKEPIKYEATEYEYNSYETFETAIRNI